MSGCGNCSGSCASCGGCGGCLELTAGEVRLLQTLAQIPFLPVARNMGDEVPVYLEDDASDYGDASLTLQLLEKRGLISIDYDKPLGGLRGDAYAAYPIHGSFALTARGQQVVEVLELQGIE